MLGNSLISATSISSADEGWSGPIQSFSPARIVPCGRFSSALCKLNVNFSRDEAPTAWGFSSSSAYIVPLSPAMAWPPLQITNSSVACTPCRYLGTCTSPCVYHFTICFPTRKTTLAALLVAITVSRWGSFLLLLIILQTFYICLVAILFL